MIAMPGFKSLLIFMSILLLAIFQHQSIAAEAPMPHTLDVSADSICHRKSGEELKIYKSRLAYGDAPTEEITIRIGKISKTIQIQDIESVTFKSNKVDKNGYVAASLSFREEDDYDSVKVQIRNKKTVLSLRGYKENGDPVTVDLLNCHSISFE